jgi:hypothetical protein
MPIVDHFGRVLWETGDRVVTDRKEWPEKFLNRWVFILKG